ncbi:unnamed protein product [Closterium sp. Yama58-4]|nr:unnamed protein product [Closterium sp. Yama58-4]
MPCESTQKSLLAPSAPHHVPLVLPLGDIADNYLVGELSERECGDFRQSRGVNCFSTAALAAEKPWVECAAQLPAAVCDAFCGLEGTTTPVCNGLGICYLDGPSRIPTCLYQNGAVQDGRIYCAPPGSVGMRELVDPTILTKGTEEATARVFTADPLALFTYRAAGQGLAFVISATNAAGTGGEGGGVGYAGMDGRSVAVEFDTYTDSAHGDMPGHHVGLNTGGSATSIAAVRSPFTLNNQKTYTAWIDYKLGTLGGPGTLSVYLATSGDKPDAPLLESPLMLCEVLKPTQTKRSFYLGFVASSVAPFQQQHAILVSFVETGEPGWGCPGCLLSLPCHLVDFVIAAAAFCLLGLVAAKHPSTGRQSESCGFE